MKAIYRDFEIEAKREMCMGGWKQVYITAYSVVSGYELICDHTSALDPVRYLYKGIKERVAEAYRTNGESECVERDAWDRAIGADKLRERLAAMSDGDLEKLRRAIVPDEELPQRAKDALAKLRERKRA